MLGTIPWSVDGLTDVMAFELKLVDTPNDDWILDTAAAVDFGK